MFSILSQRGNAHDLREILQVGVQLPNLLKGYQFSFTLKGDDSDEYSDSDLRVEIAQSGSNIKTKNTWVHSDDGEIDPMNEPIEYAYNGIHYQWFITGRETLTFSKQCRHPTPYWDPSPLIWPYYWLAGQQTNWSDIKDITKWTERFDEAKFNGHRNAVYDEESESYRDYYGKNKEGVIHFDSVVFPFPQMNMDTVQVEFAKELGYYPLACTGFANGKMCMNARVLRYKTFDIDGMLFVFPLEVKVSLWESKDDILDMHWIVDDASIQINPQLDEEMFTIPHSRAKHIADFDQMLENGVIPSYDVDDDGRDIVFEQPPKRTWDAYNVTALVFNLIVLVLLIGYYLFRKRK